jgi:hypothetical protein
VDVPDLAYKHVAGIYRELARRAGVTPAQALSPVPTRATAEDISLKLAQEPTQRIFEDRVRETAAKRGLRPEVVLDRMMSGEEPLLADGGRAQVAPPPQYKAPPGAAPRPQLTPEQYKDVQDWWAWVLTRTKNPKSKPYFDALMQRIQSRTPTNNDQALNQQYQQPAELPNKAQPRERMPQSQQAPIADPKDLVKQGDALLAECNISAARWF